MEATLSAFLRGVDVFYCGFWNVDCQLKNGSSVQARYDWFSGLDNELRITSNPKSTVRNPQFNLTQRL
jgi:hypothetical protein